MLTNIFFITYVNSDLFLIISSLNSMITKSLTCSFCLFGYVFLMCSYLGLTPLYLKLKYLNSNLMLLK